MRQHIDSIAEIDFFDFPYFTVKSVQKDSPLYTTFYADLLQQYLAEVHLISDGHNPLPPRYGECRVSDHEIYYHRYRSRIPAQYLSFILGHPDVVADLLKARAFNRLTFQTLCGRQACVHPLHIKCFQDPAWHPEPPQPRVRRLGRINDDWLTYPELKRLEFIMTSTYTKDLSDVVAEFANRIAVSFSTVVSTWNTLVTLHRRRFHESFVVMGKYERR